MIRKEDLSEIGKILKPHAVGGELMLLFNNAACVEIDTDFYFFELEGTYIPFFVEEFRVNSDVTARIKFEGIDTLEEASLYNNILIFLPTELLKNVDSKAEPSSPWDQYIGYTVVDENSTLLGTIKEVDATTINVLFIVVKENEEFLIPATDDFILKVDSERKIVQLSLPEGLL